MKYLYSIFFLMLLGSEMSAQEKREGEVTYNTSQHVYVKFSSMENISEGDTLYIVQGEKEVAALQVKNLSSISCVCIPLITSAFKVSDHVYAKLNRDISPGPLKGPVLKDTTQTAEIQEPEPPPSETIDKHRLTQVINGRISVSSYSGFNNNQVPMNQRMRYTFSMQARNLGGSKLSLESYLSFSHSNTNWTEIKDNIFNGLKIYNLSATYAFSETMSLTVGRKINPNLSSVGAIDGLQFEKKIKAFTLGAFVGSRPDYLDYGINMNLLQYGAYLGHEVANKSGSMQNTAAFIEQKNQSLTDRRFLYFQHSNMLVKNLFFFGSAEVDLYKKVDNTKENIFDLSNTYLSLRYRIIRPLSAAVSYSSRQNVIYYETYKDFLERLLETETLQGWGLSIHYRPAKYLFTGVKAGYRFRKDDPQPTRNLNGYITYSEVPGIGASVTLSTTWIETSYLAGMVYGAGISRNILSNKLNAGLQYRYVDYLYSNSEMSLIQHVGEANLSWAVYKKLSLSLHYEGTFEKELTYHRVFLNISQRF
jgi:hypothetical protein